MNDVKEICDVVLADVRKELEPVVQRYEERCRTLEKKVKDMQHKIDKIEKAQNQGEQRSSSEESNNGSKKSVESKQKETQERVSIQYIGRFFQYDGWLYYANARMGNFLYRVRADGTQNQQLTDFTLSHTAVQFMKVEDGVLFFEDANLKEHALRIV